MVCALTGSDSAKGRHRTITLRGIVRVGGALFLACCTPTEPLLNLGPVPDGRFTTDSTGYRARRIDGGDMPTQFAFAVTTRFETRGSVPLYLGRCFSNSPRPLFDVPLAQPSGAGSGYAQVWACVGHDRQFEVLPGAIRIDTLLVGGPNSWDPVTHATHGITAGVFRIAFDVRLAPGPFGGVPVPDSLRLSNAFVVRTAN